MSTAIDNSTGGTAVTSSSAGRATVGGASGGVAGAVENSRQPTSGGNFTSAALPGRAGADSSAANGVAGIGSSSHAGAAPAPNGGTSVAHPEASAGATSTGAAGAKGGSTHSDAGAAGLGIAGTAGVRSSTGAAGTSSPPSCGSELRQSATLIGARLVIMLDKSGSMGLDASGSYDNRSLRWVPVSQGLVDFFAGGNRATQASLSLFPAAGDKTTTCHADYRTPLVTMRPLPEPTAFASALAVVNPAGGTPMLSAVIGAVTYAASIEAAEPFNVTAVVLITDGEPGIWDPVTATFGTDCAPVGSTLANTIPDITAVTRSAYYSSYSILTYVIGVGQSLTSLSDIAWGGGTSMVYTSDTDPSQVRSAVSNALTSIANQRSTCSVAYPATVQGFPAASSFLNVDLQDGVSTTNLSRSTSCNASGWYYDSVANPKRIMLCPATCQAVMAGASIQVVLGCPTRVFD